MMTQVLQPSETELQIQELEQMIKKLKIEGFDMLTEDLIKLRNLVLDSHYDCWLMMCKLVGKRLYSSAHPKYRKMGYESYSKLFKQDFSHLAERLDFKGVLGICKDLNLFEKDLVKKLNLLNLTRNQAAHPANGKLFLYKDPERKKLLLQLIFDCVQGLAIEDYSFDIET
jgi:hypothetical protein